MFTELNNERANALNWKQPVCPAIGEWVNTLWYAHTMECYTEKKGVITPRKDMEKLLSAYYKVKEAYLKGYILYDFN